MREIKFRTWNYMKKEMRYQNIHGVVLGYLGINIDEKHIMQFTGLKDKNDKEIYEGDVLYCDYPEYKEERRKILEVCWDDENKTIALRRKKAKQGADWPARKDGYTYTARPSIYEIGRIYEIIGNIYENPELLK